MGNIPADTLIKEYGSVENYKDYLHTKLSGKHFWTNGVEDKKFSDDEIPPDGWWRGRTNSGKGTKGYIFINNGELQTQISQYEDIPKGWVKGALPFTAEHKQKISNALKGRIRSEEHCKAISKSHKSEQYKEKIQHTMMQKYGVSNAFQLERVINYNKSAEANAIKNATKRINHTFNSSKLEDKFFEKLLQVYDDLDIFKQYSDNRYPYACDFYIKSEDLFIEINGFVTHQNHPFDNGNPDDVLIAEQLKQKDDKWSKNILKVWTKDDPLKISTAIKNNLNYIVYYGMDISHPKICNLNPQSVFKIEALIYEEG